MATFIQTVNRIAGELRRSNLTNEIKNAIVDAVAEAAATRFYFNEMRAVPIATVDGQEYYSDAGVVEIDAAYYFNGAARYNLYEDNNLDADDRADGSISRGQLDSYSRAGGQLRFYPVPSSVMTVYLDGFGKLTPLVEDGDTNAWLMEGERYIRALAKCILMKDVIRDYSEATALEAIAGDYRRTLIDMTVMKTSTGTLRATRF